MNNLEIMDPSVLFRFGASRKIPAGGYWNSNGIELNGNNLGFASILLRCYPSLIR